MQINLNISGSPNAQLVPGMASYFPVTSPVATVQNGKPLVTKTDVNTAAFPELWARSGA